MNQALLRLMAKERLLDAQILLANSRWAYAYYIAGYAVECGLKSCVLSQMVNTGGVFVDRKFSEKCFTHTFDTLVELAGLKTELATIRASNAIFQKFWTRTTTWKETSRYSPMSQSDAERLYEAISDPTDGVMQWIRLYW